MPHRTMELKGNRAHCFNLVQAPVRTSVKLVCFCTLALEPVRAAPANLERHWPVTFHENVIRVERIAWPMRTLAARSCPRATPAIGIALDDARAYDSEARAYVRMVTGLGDWPQVLFVMPGSPAAAAGLAVGDGIIAVAGSSTNVIASEAMNPDLRAEAITNFIAARPLGQPLDITVLREGERISLTVSPIAVCSSQFVVTAGKGIEAYSDESNVALTGSLVEFTANDDELAFVMGHELAHIIHRDVNGVTGRKRRSSKQTERDADWLGADLTFCIGLNPQRAADYWSRLSKSDWRTLFGSFTHPSFRSRIDFLEKYQPPSRCPPSPRVAIKPF